MKQRAALPCRFRRRQFSVMTASQRDLARPAVELPPNQRAVPTLQSTETRPYGWVGAK